MHGLGVLGAMQVSTFDGTETQAVKAMIEAAVGNHCFIRHDKRV